MNKYQNRLDIYRETLGEPEKTVRGDSLGKFPIDVLAFPRNFSEECEVGPAQNGYVLITNGMSELVMNTPDSGEDGSRAELVWYVEDVTQEKIDFMYWLATVPFIDSATFRFGDFVLIPDPPIENCSFQKVMFLTPIIKRDKMMVYDLSDIFSDEPFSLLTINLISDSEHEFAKKDDDHFNLFMDLLDQNKYPRRFTVKRKSIL